MQHDDHVIRDLMRQAFRQYVGLSDAPDARPNHDDYAPYISQEEMEDDVWAVNGLFDILKEERDDKGAIVSISPARVEPGSPRERQARAAAARLLRAGAWKNCGETCQSALRRLYTDLADLFAPDGDGEFELVLRRRAGRKGPARSDQLNIWIAHSLAYQVQRDGCVEAAVSDAVRRFGVSEKTVWNIWKEEGKYLLDTWNFIERVPRPAE